MLIRRVAACVSDDQFCRAVTVFARCRPAVFAVARRLRRGSIMSAPKINFCRNFNRLMTSTGHWTGQDLRETRQGLPGRTGLAASGERV